MADWAVAAIPKRRKLLSAHRVSVLHPALEDSGVVGSEEASTTVAAAASEGAEEASIAVVEGVMEVVVMEAIEVLGTVTECRLMVRLLDRDRVVVVDMAEVEAGGLMIAGREMLIMSRCLREVGIETAMVVVEAIEVEEVIEAAAMAEVDRRDRTRVLGSTMIEGRGEGIE